MIDLATEILDSLIARDNFRRPVAPLEARNYYEIGRNLSSLYSSQFPVGQFYTAFNDTVIKLHLNYLLDICEESDDKKTITLRDEGFQLMKDKTIQENQL